VDVLSVPTESGCEIEVWRSLADVAIRGLHEIYARDTTALPHTLRWDGHTASCRGRNVRYALIALLGLAKGTEVIGAQEELVHSLWRRVIATGDSRNFTAGDLGLGLWARALHGVGDEVFTVDRAFRTYRNEPAACDSVDLAWLLLGSEHVIHSGAAVDRAEQLAREAKSALLTLYNPDTSLFYRHARRALASRVSRRIACFANQIYPVMALAAHVRRTGCNQAADIAGAVAGKLCKVQGDLGQWWWLYDVDLGEIVDGYPVFAVHQDAMAPMALLEASTVLDRCYAEPIQRGIRWVLGYNERGQSMVLPEHGLVLRDIHKRGVGRVRRMFDSILWCCGRHGRWGADGRSYSFEINRECRPYHLGWILYTAGLVLGSDTGLQDDPPELNVESKSCSLGQCAPRIGTATSKNWKND